MRHSGPGSGSGSPAAQAQARAQLGLGPHLIQVLAEGDDLDGAEGARELIEHDESGFIRVSRHGRRPAHTASSVFWVPTLCTFASALLHEGRHAVRAAHAVGRQLARLDAAGREHEQRLRAADQAELLDERLVRGQPLRSRGCPPSPGRPACPGSPGRCGARGRAAAATGPRTAARCSTAAATARR